MRSWALQAKWGLALAANIKIQIVPSDYLGCAPTGHDLPHCAKLTFLNAACAGVQDTCNQLVAPHAGRILDAEPQNGGSVEEEFSTLKYLAGLVARW